MDEIDANESPLAPQKTESGGFSSTAFYSAHNKVKLRRIKTYLTEKMFVVQVENLSDLSDFEGKTTCLIMKKLPF